MVLRSDIDDYMQVARWRAEDALERIPVEPADVTSARRETLRRAITNYRTGHCPGCGRRLKTDRRREA